MKDNSFISGSGIYYEGALQNIKKDKNPMRPIYEAFTNSLESIRMLKKDEKKDEINIKIKYKSKQTLFGDNPYEFSELIIEDTGGGFDNNEFERFKTLNDNRKGFKNKGSGRIQFLHFFKETHFISIYEDLNESNFKEREFIISKENEYIRNNAIIFHIVTKPTKKKSLMTTVIFKNPYQEKDSKFYNDLTLVDLKEKILTHYLSYFCENRNQLPQISLEKIIDNDTIETLSISQEDIPEIDKEYNLDVYYYKIANNKQDLEKIEKKEQLKLKTFKIHYSNLAENSLKLINKGEVATEIKLDCLSKKDQIDDFRYLFLLSGHAIDERVDDHRGKVNIPRKNDFIKENKNSFFYEEELIIECIEEEANDAILSIYNEIREKNKEKHEEITKLKNMFLLNEETIKSLRFSVNDTEEKILSEIYRSDAKVIAKRDAVIKEHLDRVSALDPTNEKYEKTLLDQVNSLVQLIPLQNRTSITHYVARRKLILELFKKILERNLEVQKNEERNMDEKLLHNLIFQQSSNDPENSDLWIVNEDFIYFKGTSEDRLFNISINGIKVLREHLTPEENEFRLSLGEDKLKKRPDVLLFPDEQKCIIIEFKNPDVNLSEHLNQINNYATLILNFSKPEFNFTTFYGYLVGQKVTANEVRSYDSEFKYAAHFDYLFRPNKTIANFFGQSEGSLYTEVIKYTTLLERAKMRNEIFIKKILK